jgi:hypothetical protein
VRDPDQEVRVSGEDEAPASGPPQAAARPDDGTEVLLGDQVAGLLGQLADGCRLDGLAPVQPPAGGEPCEAAVPVAEAEQQDALERVKDEHPGGRPPAGSWRHAHDATGLLMPEGSWAIGKPARIAYADFGPAVISHFRSRRQGQSRDHGRDE